MSAPRNTPLRDVSELKSPPPSDLEPSIPSPDLLAEELFNFVNVPKDYLSEEMVVTKHGEVKEFTRRIPRTPPMISEFARRYGMTKRELENLAQESPALRRSLEFAEDVVKEFMVHFGLLGDYNASYAQFASTNLTDMKDKREVDVRRLSIEAKLKQIEEEGDPLIAEVPKKRLSPKAGIKKAMKATVLPKRP